MLSGSSLMPACGTLPLCHDKMLRDNIKKTIGFEDDILELIKEKVFGATEKHQQYIKMSMIYRPFVLTSVSTMVYLTLMIEFLNSANFP